MGSTRLKLLKFILIAFFLECHRNFCTEGLLYPQESETREMISLDGMWTFVKVNPNDTEYPPELSLLDVRTMEGVISMPVPSSYNDITQDATLRDHVGTVLYERKFFVPLSWKEDKRVMLRFESVRMSAYVYVNEAFALHHYLGHLPFEDESTYQIRYGQENNVRVRCDNVLSDTTLPQGVQVKTQRDSGEVYVQQASGDFFNYAGIDRSVILYTVPKTYIADIITSTDLVQDGQSLAGMVSYEIVKDGDAKSVSASIKILDKEGNVVSTSESDSDLKGTAKIDNVKPWWPYLMHSEPGYLYTMEISLTVDGQERTDVYRLKIGIRTLRWNEKTFLINGKPLYLRGFASHEDSNIRGKGLDLATITKDFNLYKWLGANAFRTSHYPYSQEVMNFADEQGIMVIDECQAVSLDNFFQSNDSLLDTHTFAFEELVNRDRNHPSVIAWSIANEPRSATDDADKYFKDFVDIARTMIDTSRPITASLNTGVDSDRLAQYLDIISVNQYNGWYHETGNLEQIPDKLVNTVTKWHQKYNRPIIVSEYGAGSIVGLHSNPDWLFNEEYQTDLYSKHFEAFDTLRENDTGFIGEFIWCFADFKTGPSALRPNGNRKGLLTRDRQPKSAAHLVRKRYFSLSEEMDGTTLPKDIFPYVSSGSKKRNSNL